MNFSGKHITLKHLLIDKQKMIGLQFYKDRVIEALIKELPHLNWSEEYSMYYTKNTKKNLNLIFSIFKGTAWINGNYFFKNRIINPENEKPDTTWFQNRKTSVIYRSCPKNYLQKLELKRYTNNTIRNYVAAFEAFINFYHNKKLIEIN